MHCLEVLLSSCVAYPLFSFFETNLHFLSSECFLYCRERRCVSVVFQYSCLMFYNSSTLVKPWAFLFGVAMALLAEHSTLMAFTKRRTMGATLTTVNMRLSGESSTITSNRRLTSTILQTLGTLALLIVALSGLKFNQRNSGNTALPLPHDAILLNVPSPLSLGLLKS